MLTNTDSVQLVILLCLSDCQTTDVNECQHNNGGCSQVCINTNGSYSCDCNDGFVLKADNYTCDNVDECSLGLHNCSDLCQDTVGSFQCDCTHGFLLQADNVTCKDIDECNSTETNSLCSHSCTNTNGSYFCSCPDGLVLLGTSCECPVGSELQSDQTTCMDVDECSNLTHSCSHLCNNTIGGYTCSCPGGMALESDGVTCQDDEEHEINVALIAGVVISNVAVLSVIGILLLFLRSYQHRMRQLSHPENGPASNGRESHVYYNVATESEAQEAPEAEVASDEHHAEIQETGYAGLNRPVREDEERSPYTMLA